MPEGLSTTATAASTLATGTAAAVPTVAAAAGRPPEEVILWAFLGSLVAVYLDRSRDTTLSMRWAASTAGLVLVSVLSGIVGSALVLQLAPAWSWTAPLAAVERWVLAFAIAALIHKAGPLAWGVVRRIAATKGASDDGRPA